MHWPLGTIKKEKSERVETIDPNKIHISTPRLMNIPPKESEIEKEKEFKENLRKEGKFEFKVCCNDIRNFIQGAIELGITKRELNILKESLHQHPLDRFGRNKHEKKGRKEIDLDSLIEEVFEISTFFDSPEVSKYFLNKFFQLVQKENTNPYWAITLERFNKKWANKLEAKDSSIINQNPMNKEEKSITISGSNYQVNVGSSGNNLNVNSEDKIEKPKKPKWLIPLIIAIISGVLILLFEYGIIQKLF